MPLDDTDIGKGSGRFPATRWSAVLGARSMDEKERERSLETLVSAYWKPVYKYIRIKWRRSNEDAKDLTQEFFARAMEKEFFAAYDPARGRFRTFLRVCLEAFLSNESRDARRIKRGGGVFLLSLEFERAEGELAAADPPSPESIERTFDREWVRSLFELGVEALREECARRGRQTHFALFERYDLEAADSPKVSYQDLADEMGITVTQVTNYLSIARREFRRLLLETLRSVTASDEEFRLEARLLLGREEPDGA